jgi:hypothetical protein
MTPSTPGKEHMGSLDYEWHVEIAAKGLAARDSHPMPRSVTTPEAFYQVMAASALDAIGLRSIIERAARAERELELRDEQAGTTAERGRHRRRQRDGGAQTDSAERESRSQTLPTE